MKKHFLLLLMTTLCFNAFSQDSEENQIMRVSARIGLNGSSLLFPRSMNGQLLEVPETFFPTQIASGSYNMTSSLKIGATAGLLFDFQLKEKLSLQTGLFYMLQRCGQVQSAVFNDTSNTHFSITSDNVYKIHHLKIPVMVKYCFSTNPKSFVVGAGLYFDCALGGDITYDASAVVTSNSNEISKYVASGNFDPFKKDMKYLYYHKDYDDYMNKYNLYYGNIFNRFDMGVALEIGYQINKFYVGVHADIGLLNMMNKQFSGEIYSQHNANFQLQFGYKIN
ncbi:MAG: PorT family protein [Bacteroidales bacterium]|nr:PorT family protein [Bacteroidales bacterium]